MKVIHRHIQNHTSMINLFTYLSNNWHIGMISGMLTWVITKMPFLFQDNNLKLFGAIGLILTVLVGALTLILKMLDLYDNIRKRFKKQPSKQ